VRRRVSQHGARPSHNLIIDVLPRSCLGGYGGIVQRKTIYLLLCIVGVILPYWQFMPWVAANGLNLHVFFQQLFANRVGGFFGMDVFVSAVALLVFARAERASLAGPLRWLPLLAVLTVGVSLAPPLLLYLRERRPQAIESDKAMT